MGLGVPGWSPDLERSFKEVLYRFLEEVQSTKAALYLLGTENTYVLMTQYGFGRRDLLAAELNAHDPLVKKVRELKGEVRVFNQREELHEIAHYLEGAATSRLLLVPLNEGATVAGFVDVRDKGRKRPFEPADVGRAREIGHALQRLLAQAGLIAGERPVSSAPATAAPAALELSMAGPSTVLLDSAALAELREVASDLLFRPGVTAVALTVVEPGAAGTLLLTGAGGREIDRQALKRHQADALARHPVGLEPPESWELEARAVLNANQPQSPARVVATEVLGHAGEYAVVASVLGGLGSSAVPAALERLIAVAAAGHERARLRRGRRLLARRLLVPGERELPELAAHSQAVSRLAWSLASALELDEEAREDAALAGLLHDVGMRELDYGRLYRHAAPGQEERRRYQEHVLIGDKILRDLDLETVRLAVRHHHERWDGKGYPDRLSAAAIPLLARLVHVAEVYDVLTSPTSYRSPVDPPKAAAILRGEAGRQFDTDLVELLLRRVG